MAIAYTGGVGNTPDSTPRTSIASGALSTTSGRLLVIAAYGYNPSYTGASISGVTDTAGNTYTQAASYGDDGIIQAIWYAYNITGNANNSVTVTFGQSLYYVHCLQHEYSGALTTDPLDTSRNGTTGNGTSLSTEATTSNYANSMMLAFYTISATPTFTAGSGFTSRLNSMIGQSEDDVDLGAAGSYGSAMTSGTGASWCGIHSIFRQASAAAVGYPYHTFNQ